VPNGLLPNLKMTDALRKGLLEGGLFILHRIS
jgi:hypothetical protein